MKDKAQKVTGIGGIFFRTRNPDAIAAWYEKHLGISTKDGHTDFFWREHERPDQIGRTAWALFPADTDYFGPSKPAFMINYRVENLDRMLEQLRRDGVKVEKSRTTTTDGSPGLPTLRATASSYGSPKVSEHAN